MLIEDFISRVGGTVKRRSSGDEEYRTYDVLNEKYAYYYYNLQQHGFDFQL